MGVDWIFKNATECSGVKFAGSEWCKESESDSAIVERMLDNIIHIYKRNNNKMASKRACDKAKDESGEDSGSSDEDSDSCNGFCIKEWWEHRELLKWHANHDFDELMLQKRSKILRYLYQAQLFEEKFGSDAFSDIEKEKRQKYEWAARLKAKEDAEKIYPRNAKAKKRKVNYDLIDGMLETRTLRFVDPATGIRKQGKTICVARLFPGAPTS